MSHPMRDQLRELADEVRDLEVLPAAEVRARGRRRGRRQVAAVTAAGAVAAVTAGVALAWPQQRTALPAFEPPASSPVTCVLTLPDSPADVQVRVRDEGLASELRKRRFTVLDGTPAPASANATVLRYGPAAIGAATVLRAALPGEATLEFDPDRQDSAIDLIPGPDFTRLATPTEMNQNLAEIGEPTAPPQCR